MGNGIADFLKFCPMLDYVQGKNMNEKNEGHLTFFQQHEVIILI